MKILRISHSCVIEEYQRRMGEVAKYPNIKLTLLVPKLWVQFNEKVFREKGSDFHYRAIPIQRRTWRLEHSGMRKVIAKRQHQAYTELMSGGK